MSLLEQAESDLSAFENYNIEQVLAICGDGKLLDGSDCSNQLRRYLELQKPHKLAGYANHCLDNSFPKSGEVLQDVVNEIGRRIGYDVQNGRYRGSSTEIAFDGLWQEGNTALVVEVKTTDAYRINLDTVVKYATRSNSEHLVETEPNVLLVVGRKDTGDLEAQVRGSRHAWQVRLVSIESLIKLMSVREDIGEKAFVSKVRRILLPFEYTRVDHIIDLVFETQREVEDKITDADDETDTNAQEGSGGGTWVFTPANELDAKRNELLTMFYRSHGEEFRRITRAKYVNDQHKVRVVCSISKRYARDYQPYWYAFHPAWLEFLEQGTEGYFILGCMDRNEGFAIPLTTLKSNLHKLNRTEKVEKYYWHIALSQDNDGLFLNMSKTGEKLYLDPFAFA